MNGLILRGILLIKNASVLYRPKIFSTGKTGLMCVVCVKICVEEVVGIARLTEKQKKIQEYLKNAWELSDRSVARALGVSHSTVGRVRQEMIQSGRFDHLSNEDEEWMNHPYIQANKGLLETLNPRGLRAIKRLDVLDYMMTHPQIKSPCVAQAYLEREKRQKRKDARVVLNINDVDIRVADVRQVGQFDWIRDNSVDLCICDPPWGKLSPVVCEGISKVAATKLRDGGSLLVLVGGSYLPDVITALSSDKRLRYHWLLTCKLPQGSPASVSWLKVQSKVRLVLWFVKGKYSGDIVADYIDRPTSDNTTDKSHHEWGAPEELVSELIRRFTDPGDTIADFTVGGGTTAVSSVLLCRRFLGTDIDAEAIKTTMRRVRRLFGYTK